jgi:GMP synthase (glutamine-hydrolysing)
VAAISGPTHETPWESLATLARDIPNRIPGINRVVLVLNKPQAPDTVREVTRTTLTPETTDKLRLLDHIVTSSFDKAGLMTKISQLLTVLVPVDTSGDQGHSVAIRGVVTSDFMTARPARLGDEIPWTLMQHVTQQLANQPGVDLVMYDLTSKPPATVEWE